MQTQQSIAANTWEDFKCLMGLRKARGSRLEYRAREVITSKKKKEIVTNKNSSGDPWDNGKCQVSTERR